METSREDRVAEAARTGACRGCGQAPDQDVEPASGGTALR